MPRGTPLAQALVMLKNKIKANITPGVAISNDSTYAMDISRYQQQLCDKMDWPFLRGSWDLVTVPYPSVPSVNPTTNQPWRYYNFPTLEQSENNTVVAINFQRPLAVYVWWSEQWQGPIPSGIGVEEYNFRNSDGSPPDSGNPPDVLDPIQRWDYNDQNQFEVWPIPASAGVLRFVGQRVPNPLIDLSSVTPNWNATLDLDDELVTLHAAGEILAQMEQAHARLMQQAAASRMAFLMATTPTRTRKIGFGGKPDVLPNRLVPVRKVIAVA
jgi:hypothetical protein